MNKFIEGKSKGKYAWVISLRIVINNIMYLLTILIFYVHKYIITKCALSNFLYILI